jgi:hypothetical protein
MQEQQGRIKSLSTSDVQKVIFERRLKQIHRRQGFSRSEIIKKANNPKIYRKIERTRKVK